MPGTVGGSVRLVSSLTTTIPAAAGLNNGYAIPAGLDYSIFFSPGTGPRQGNRVYSSPGIAAAAPASIDLSTIVTADGQVGLSHWRVLIVCNDDPVNPLVWDFTATHANTEMFAAGGVTAKLTIEPGGFQAFVKPLGTNGGVIDSTHNVVALDPGANTVSYRFIALGD